MDQLSLRRVNILRIELSIDRLHATVFRQFTCPLCICKYWYQSCIYFFCLQIMFSCFITFNFCRVVTEYFRLKQHFTSSESPNQRHVQSVSVRWAMRGRTCQRPRVRVIGQRTPLFGGYQPPSLPPPPRPALSPPSC